jgi:hypothetical protein
VGFVKYMTKGIIMKNGLWRVETKFACFGFVLLNDRIIKAAPMFWKRQTYWMSIAKWISE